MLSIFVNEASSCEKGIGRKITECGQGRNSYNWFMVTRNRVWNSEVT